MSENKELELITEYFDEEESANRYKEREEILKKRRAEAKRKQMLKRKLVILGALLIMICIVLALLVFGIRKIVKSIGNKQQTSVDITMDSEAMNTPMPTPTPTPEIPKFLGYNKSLESGKPMAGGNELFIGYKAEQNSSTYYIDSEKMTSQYAILIDATDGTVVCQREGYTRINPASMTKVLTVLVAAENLTEDDLDKEVTILEEDKAYAIKNGLSSVGFETDEVVTVKDLFYGTILPSGADAANALAKYVAGDVDSFVDLMNKKINELGLTGTHFTNCVGSYNENHYSTCADMAMILKAAIENEFCYEVLKEHKYTTSVTTQHPEGIEISNWFLRRIEDKDTDGEVLCAKTGFVNESGNCAVSFSKQNNGHTYLCVTAQTWSAWRCIYDHVELYFNNAGLG